MLKRRRRADMMGHTFEPSSHLWAKHRCDGRLRAWASHRHRLQGGTGHLDGAAAAQAHLLSRD